MSSRHREKGLSPPLDWEGLSLGEQAAKVREHLHDRRVLGTPRQRGQRVRRQRRPTYTRAERAAWKRERAAVATAVARGLPSPPTPLLDAYYARQRADYAARQPERERQEAARRAKWATPEWQAEQAAFGARVVASRTAPLSPEGHRQRARHGYPDLTGHRPRSLIDYVGWAVPIALALWLGAGVLAAALGG